MSDDLIEKGKESAAIKAVDENVKKGMVLGIGSGSTVVYAVKRIAELNNEDDLDLKCIPTSFQAYNLIIDNSLNLVSIDMYPIIDLDIDGADEIDKDLNAIKGGGGCLVQEKIIASISKNFILIADHRKDSKFFGENWKKGIPIEIIPLARVPLMKKFDELGGKPILRMAKAKAGPLVTDNGNFIIDVDFGIVKKPSQINKKILMIPGVVDTGLFIGMASKAYFGQKDGSVTTR